MGNPYFLKDINGGYYNKYPEFQIWEDGRKAGIREEQKRMTKALRELHKQGWTLSDVIEAEDTMGEESGKPSLSQRE